MQIYKGRFKSSESCESSTSTSPLIRSAWKHYRKDSEYCQFIQIFQRLLVEYLIEYQYLAAFFIWIT